METPTVEPEEYESVDFKGDCGEAPERPKVAISTGMKPFQQATINGGPVQNCVVGNGGAVVYNISLIETTEPIYKYRIKVDGRGPKGVGSGYFYLAFTDETGDTYYLKLYESSRKEHHVSFNSEKPDIQRIWWCNKSFAVPS